MCEFNRQLLFRVTSAGIIVLMGLVLYVGWTLVWPFQVITIQQPIRVLTPVVQAGQSLVISMDYCKHIDLVSSILPTLVNDEALTLPQERGNIPLGCRRLLRSFTVPAYAHSGSYVLRTTLEYQVYPWRHVSLTVVSERFQVVAQPRPVGP